MQPDVDQMPASSPTSSPTGRTAQEVAALLGISVEAVRGRIKRGTLQSTKAGDGTVLVYLDEGNQSSGQAQPAADQAHDQTQSDPEPVANQSELVQVLLNQLEAEREANRENRRIIAILASRVPELEPAREASSEATGGHVSGHVSGSDNGSNGDAPLEPERRSWWRRLFEG